MKRYGTVLGLIFGVLPTCALAQSLNIDLGQSGPGTTSRIIQLTVLITVLSLAPSLLVMTTAFTRIIIVLSLLRNALGAQGTPPNTVLIGLGLFLTLFVMQPTLEQSWTRGMVPMMNGDVSEIEGLQATAQPFHSFMVAHVRPADLSTFMKFAHLQPVAKPADVPWRALVPAFMTGELRRGFEMGFMLYLPFLIIDLVVSSILMSLGMMMLPPSSVSLPFKLIFFVMVDGWQLVAGTLVRSFGAG